VPDRQPIILLADDDEDDRQLAAEALAQTAGGTELRCMPDGEALLEHLRRAGAEAPDIILLDLNMPRKDGREVLADLRADPVLRRIPVVVLTTSKDEADVVASYDLGASSFVTKPVTFAGLVEALRDVTHYWFERVRLPAGPPAAAA
jgi:CheY-like chemotaxis protein